MKLSFQILALTLFGAVSDTCSAPGDLKWAFTTERAIRSSPALGTNGWVIFGSHDGNVYAVEPTTAELKWKTGTGGRVVSSPTVAESGLVYIGTTNGLLALSGTTGGRQFHVQTGEVLSTAALGRNGQVYFFTEPGRVLAVDELSGAEARQARPNRFGLIDLTTCYSSPVLSSTGTIFVGASKGLYLGSSPNGSVWAFDHASGEQLWITEGYNWFQSSAALGEDGTVFLGGFDKAVYAHNPRTGATNWMHRTGDSISASASIGPDGTLYVGAHDGFLYALDSQTGARKWKFRTGDSIHSTAAIAADGTIYFGSYDNNIYALDGATGAKKWSFTTQGHVLSSPLIGPDGTVYIGSHDGKLYALEGSAPLAESPWPMFQRNVRHTGAADQ